MQAYMSPRSSTYIQFMHQIKVLWDSGTHDSPLSFLFTYIVFIFIEPLNGINYIFIPFYY